MALTLQKHLILLTAPVFSMGIIMRHSTVMPNASGGVAVHGADHLQLARAVSGYYVDIQEKTGGRDDPRLVPLLACLLELLPWIKQWHNDIDPEFQTRMGDYFEGFVQEKAKQLGKTLDEIRAWEPEKKKSISCPGR